MPAIHALSRRNWRFRFVAAPTLLAVMLVWPRQHRQGPPRLPHELWALVAREFVLQSCLALNLSAEYAAEDAVDMNS